MSKALLTGNGMTSFLIPAYRDTTMIERFCEAEPGLYERINNDFYKYRLLKPLDFNMRREKIIEYLGSNNASSLYFEYFIDFGLMHEIESENERIIGIETLLKVSRLLKYSDSDYDIIKRTANIICFNYGDNGVHAIDNSRFDLEKAHTFMSGFSQIYTTNYDNILEGLSEVDIKHLHGGFYYYKEHQENGQMDILKAKELQPVEKAYLVWGVQSKEKEEQLSGGFTFPMSFPINFSGDSILRKYYDDLTKMEIDELHVLGYSGQNDSHINKSIERNASIKRIIKYCNPYNELDNENYKSEVKNSFSNKISVEFMSWDIAWANMLE